MHIVSLACAECKWGQSHDSVQRQPKCLPRRTQTDEAALKQHIQKMGSVHPHKSPGKVVQATVVLYSSRVTLP